MKAYRQLKLVAAALAALLATACSDGFDDHIAGIYQLKPTLYRLSLSATEKSFGSEGGTDTVQVQAIGTGWRLKSAAQWLTATPDEGQGGTTLADTLWTDVSLTAQPNTDIAAERKAVSMLESTTPDWDYAVPLTVTQAPATLFLRSVGDTDFEVGGRGGIIYISFETNGGWQLSTSSGITCEEMSGTGSRHNLKLTVAPSPYTYGNNTMTVKVTSTDNSRLYVSYSVLQLPVGITVSESGTIDIEATAAELSLTVESDMEWTAAAPAWISLDPKEGGVGKTLVKIIATDNGSKVQRSGYIYFYMGGTSMATAKKYVSLNIRQSGQRLTLDGVTGEQVVSAAAQTLTMPVSSNAEWHSEVYPADACQWLTLSPETATGDGELKVNTSYNNSADSRQATVRVYTGESFSSAIIACEFVLKQKGLDLDADQHLLSFSDKASTQLVQITADAPWAAWTTDSWIKLLPASGTGTATMSVSVSENTAEAQRTGQIELTMGEQTLLLSVVQRGKFMQIGDATFNFGSAGGKGDLYLYTNDKWTAATADGADWLTLAPTSGSDSACVQITAKRNNRMVPRQTAVVVTTGSGRKYSVPVVQDVRYLRSNTASITFLGSGGQQGPIVFDTDGTYKLSCTADWVTIAADEATGGYLLTAAPNTTGKQRTATLTATCTDLEEGSLQLKIALRQVGSDTDLQLTHYEADADWNLPAADGFKVTLNRYAADHDWNGDTNK